MMMQDRISFNKTGKVISCNYNKEKNKYEITMKIGQYEYNIFSLDQELTIGKIYNVKGELEHVGVNYKFINKPIAIEILEE